MRRTHKHAMQQLTDYANDLTGFERRLLDQLHAVAAQNRRGDARPVRYLPRRRFAWRGRLAAATALAAAIALGLQLTAVGPGSMRPGGGAPASAIEVLDRLAKTAAAQPVGVVGTYYYTKVLTGETLTGSIDGRRWQAEELQTNQTWVSANQHGTRAVRVKAEGPQYRFATPADEQRFNQYLKALLAVRPLRGRQDPRTPKRLDRSYTVAWTQAQSQDDKHDDVLPDGTQDENTAPILSVQVELPDRIFDGTIAVAALPTQPAALDATITKIARRYAKDALTQAKSSGGATPTRQAFVDAYRWQLVLSLLGKPAAGPQLRSAAFELASRLPGVTVADRDATDRLGRHGVKLATATVDVTGALTQTEVIFDPATAKLLSSDTIVPDAGCARGCPGAGSANHHLTSQIIRTFTVFITAGPVASPRTTP